MHGSAQKVDIHALCRATIPLGSNLGQVLYTHCLLSFSSPRNWGTKGFSAPKWLTYDHKMQKVTERLL